MWTPMKRHAHRTEDRSTRPEKRLMAAVLTDAIAVLTSRRADADESRLAEEAWNWVLAHDSEWPFSFENVCDVLDLDPDRVRMTIHRRMQPRRRLRVVETNPCEETKLRLVS